MARKQVKYIYKFSAPHREGTHLPLPTCGDVYDLNASWGRHLGLVSLAGSAFTYCLLTKRWVVLPLPSCRAANCLYMHRVGDALTLITRARPSVSPPIATCGDTFFPVTCAGQRLCHIKQLPKDQIGLSSNIYISYIHLPADLYQR